MDLNSHLERENSKYTISQDVTTTPGATYEVTFQLNHNDDYGSSYNGFVKLIGKTSTGTPTVKKISFSHPKNSKEWALKSFIFKATSTQSSLQIGSSTEGTCGPVIDDVKMHLVNNIISNGCFESAKCPGGSKSCVYPADQASSQIYPWTVVDGTDFEIVKNGIFALNLTNLRYYFRRK